MPIALTIAGSDCSGGAGIQADLKTMTCCGVFGMSCVTALTAQNTTGVYGVQEVTPDFLARQLDCVFTDIRPQAVKTGMVSSAPLIETIADKLTEYHAENLVVDPVMVSTSGSRLLSKEAIGTLKSRLLPLAALATPNLAEAEVLSGRSIHTAGDMLTAAQIISGECGCAVLCKGGHRTGDANDLLYWRGEARWYEGARIDNPNTHGTGCTLSAAIASGLARGLTLDEAIAEAKAYLTGALEAMLDLGQGSGPLWHGWNLF
ncbi:MAG: bifunctional hydroxymethylpyrimidine kinase/phosphomethylpyrimidine kinase [Clostridiales bacterium]|nr:bifunctional hydroxymethylpyrimidine kinase/phosphomethylpyrimidine kinase [Clostridiales bacterium]